MQVHINSKPGLINLLILLNAFLGISALIPGGAFIIAPDGHLLQMPISVLKNSPFSDFRLPGLLLFVFIGIYPVFVAFSLWKRPTWLWPDIVNPFKHFHWSWAGSLAAGVILIVWILTEVQFMSVAFLHVFYFALGILILLVTLLRNVRAYYRLEP